MARGTIQHVSWGGPSPYYLSSVYELKDCMLWRLLVEVEKVANGGFPTPILDISRRSVASGRSSQLTDLSRKWDKTDDIVRQAVKAHYGGTGAQYG